MSELKLQPGLDWEVYDDHARLYRGWTLLATVRARTRMGLYLRMAFVQWRFSNAH